MAVSRPVCAWLTRLGVHVAPAILIALLFVHPSPVHADVLDRVVAIVNDEAIPLSELRNKWEELQKAPATADLPPTPEALLNRMVERQLELQYAKAQHLTASDKDVEAALKQIIQDNHLPSMDALEARLSAEGKTLDSLRADVREQITIMRAVEREVRAKVKVTEQDQQRYYDAHRGEFATAPAVRVRQILFATPGLAAAARQETQAAIDRLRAQVTDRATFQAAEARLAGTKGVATGEVGTFHPGELRTDLSDLLFAAPEGGIVGPVELPTGTALFLVDAHTAGDPLPFESARAAITERLTVQAMERRYLEWLEELRWGASIEIRPFAL